MVLGNMEVVAPTLLDDNLKIYMQTFTLNNVDNFLSVAHRLSAQTTNPHLINKLIQAAEGGAVPTDNDDSSNSFLIGHGSLSALGGNSGSRNLLIVSAVIGTMLVVLVVFTLVLISIVVRIKRRNRKSLVDRTNNNNNIMEQSMQRFGSGKSGTAGVGGARATIMMIGGGKANANKSTRSEKHMRQEFEQIQKQVDALEMQIRGRCVHAYQQLHQDYVNELNNELIYNVYSMPMWNYVTYLMNFLRVDLGLADAPLPSSSSSSSSSSNNHHHNNGHIMSSSSMSNSTTNTLLSHHNHHQVGILNYYDYYSVLNKIYY